MDDALMEERMENEDTTETQENIPANTEKTIILSGGTITISFSGNLLTMTDAEYRFVLRIFENIRQYEDIKRGK